MGFWPTIRQWTLGIWLAGTLCIWALPSLGTPFPHYQIDVKYQASDHRLQGKVLLTYSPEHYPQNELLFALPMNRFRAPDVRGPRNILQAPVFSLDSFRRIEDDPLFPSGFNPGKISIHSVTDIHGNPLEHQIRDNPDMIIGFSTEKGLLSVQTQGALPEGKLIIEFSTKLPERFQEGWVDEELLAVEWHPVLLRFLNEQWGTHFREPSPGTYEVAWEASSAGALITTTAAYTEVPANERVELPPSRRPLKYFPLVFSPNYSSKSDVSSEVQSFYLQDHERRAQLLEEWGKEFLQFVKDEYQLPQPWDHMFVVEVQGNHEQVSVLNNLILVTTPHYERTGLLDRRVLGFYSRGIGEMWFGESVWHNNDTQLWLSRGLGTFFSLRFYAHKYGNDGGIFDFIDWLNPRYREHFVEVMARNIKRELQQPIISPVQVPAKTSETRIIMRSVTYKAALVVSMLEYMLHQETFHRGFQHFYTHNLYQVATDRDLQKSMELYSEEDLDWFFNQWFHTNKEMDYAVGDVESEPLPGGRYEIRVEVVQLEEAVMPVEVLVLTDDGEELRKRSTGKNGNEVVVFEANSPADEVSLDPDEYLLELERINNYDFTHLRVRFAMDWKKQREVMSLVIPRVGSNAIDGNQVGVESNNSFGKYNLLLTPGYGTKNQQFLYIVQLQRAELFFQNLTGRIRFSQLGGTLSRGIAMDYNTPRRRERLSYSLSAEVAQETVFRTRTEEDDEEEDEDAPEETGDTSNFSVGHLGQVGFSNFYFPSWAIGIEQPLIDLGADFSYTLLRTRLNHLFNLGFHQRFLWTWIYDTTYGTSPLQKKHQLGSPQVLRGYPQRTILRDDQLLAMRFDYEFPILTDPWWGNFSTLGMQGILFYDWGKVWGNDGSFEDAKQRQDAGIGIQWGVDTVALLQFPLKIEIAYPIEDSEFNRPQFVFAGALSFF